MDLRSFRLAAGLTLEQVAKAIPPTSKGTLSKIENGLLAPGGALLLRLSEWAEAERKRRRLPLSYRIDWSPLLELSARRRKAAQKKAGRKGKRKPDLGQRISQATALAGA